MMVRSAVLQPASVSVQSEQVGEEVIFTVEMDAEDRQNFCRNDSSDLTSLRIVVDAMAVSLDRRLKLVFA